ncbi:NAD(P)/FAD-dependent oxidoreductase [Ammoniphilus sp. CFH 90114]|nr:NAD(P)/FAD-dependent oxidoreductase [Ammoniphilus sp. CFH 90114]
MGDMQKRIVILGAGFGGLTTAVTLQRKMKLHEAEIILVNKNSYHHVTTWLHELAAGTSPMDKCMVDIEKVLQEDKVKLVKGEVSSIDFKQKKVELNGGASLTYDYLVMALGSETETFGVPGVKEHTYVIRSITSAVSIRDQIERMFRKSKIESFRRENLHFIICGSGFTGVEFAGELADRVDELCKEYGIDRNKVRISNVEASPHVLAGFDPDLSEYAKTVLKRKGVDINTSTPVQECTPRGVLLDEKKELQSPTVVWTAGVRGHSLTAKFMKETIRGRLKVDQYLRPPEQEDVFVVGDSSVLFNESGGPYPPTAQIAVQQGTHCAQNLLALLRGKRMQPFQPRIKGTIVSIGKKEAAGVVYGRKIYGTKAVWMKRLVDYHYLYRIGGMKLVMEKIKLGDKQSDRRNNSSKSSDSLLDH